MQTKMKLVSTSKLIRCHECGEVLTDKESIARGIGPVCAAKLAGALTTLGQVQEAVAQGYSDAVITYHLDRYEMFLRIKKQKEASSGYLAPKLIADIRTARTRVVRRPFDRRNQLLALHGPHARGQAEYELSDLEKFVARPARAWSGERRNSA